MHLANLAGISTFITGGTGGVHRGAESTMDVSADLTELSRTPVIVVSAGIKSILDIPKTLEVLETQSVPVTVYQSNEMPAFYSGNSGIRSPSIVKNAKEVADAYRNMRGIGLKSGMLVAVPNDGGENGDKVEEAIQLVLKEVDKLGLEGREVTPYILQRVAEVTEGDSLKSNIELVKRNALVGAEIAIEVAKRNKIHKDGPQSISVPAQISHIKTEGSSTIQKVVVMGGAVVDIIAQPAQDKPLLLHTSNPGHCIESEGGVGRNIAEVLGRLGTSPLFFTAIGNDARGKAMLSQLLEECNVNVCMGRSTEKENILTYSTIEGSNTASYLAVLDHEGDLHTAVADMEVLSHIPVPLSIDWDEVDFLVMDANPPMDSLIHASKAAYEANTNVFWEPTSIPKAVLGAQNRSFMSNLKYISPNEEELIAMAKACGWCSPVGINLDKRIQWIQVLKDSAQFLLKKMNPKGNAHVVITRGSKGVLLASKYLSVGASPMQFKFELFEPDEDIKTGNFTGAGDTLCGAFVHALVDGFNEKEAVRFGMEAACISIRCNHRAISPLLSDMKSIA